MSLLDDFKKQFGIKTVNIGDVNRHATIRRPVSPPPSASNPLEGIGLKPKFVPTGIK